MLYFVFLQRVFVKMKIALICAVAAFLVVTSLAGRCPRGEWVTVWSKEQL